MKKMILTGLTAAVLSANAIAGEVTGYTAPQSGQAATAAGVDANFQALITAINDNAQRIDALEAAAGTPASLTDVVSGSTYTVAFMGNIIGKYSDALSPYNSAYLQGFGGKSILTFNGDGSMTENFQGENNREIQFEPNCTYNEVEMTEECNFTPDDESVGVEPPTTGSWSITGSTLYVTFAGETDPEEFMLTADGTMFVLMNSDFFQESDEFGSNDDYEHSIAIGIKNP